MSSPLQAMLHAASGLSLTRPVIDRAVRSRMEQTSFSDPDAYLAAMTPDELTQLVELVVVPESWFYRDAQAFQAAAGFLRERLAQGNPHARRTLRILSIPCAGGEEPYTIAMVLSDAGFVPASYTIDACDISPGCVARAKSGVYGRNAFRSQDLGFRERHFTSLGDDEYRISDAIRKQVRFRQGNLLEFDLSARTGRYDVIFCRNLLIYFDKPTTKAAIGRLEALLANDGLLFAGYAEVPSFCQHGFAPLQYAQAFGLKKEAAMAPKAPRASLKGTLPERPVRGVPPSPLSPLSLAMLARRAAAVPSRTSLATPAPALPLAAGRRAAPRAVGAPAAPEPGLAPGNLLEQARALADRGQFDQADSACRAHLAQSPDSADAYFILGLLNEHAKKPALAEDYWRRCIYLQPDHYEALCHLALLAETNSDPATAAALKARAARIYKRQQAS